MMEVVALVAVAALVLPQLPHQPLLQVPLE